MFSRIKKLAVLVVGLGFAAGAVFAQSFGNTSVPSSQGRMDLAVRSGVVIDIQEIAINVEASRESRLIGTTLGGLAGALLGSNKSWQTQAAIGVVAGIVGDQVAQRVSSDKRLGYQVVVQLDNGQVIAIAQEMNNPIMPGSPVYVVGQHPAVRVVAAPSRPVASAQGY